MFPTKNEVVAKENKTITQERWFDIVSTLEEKLFWDKDYSGDEIENIMFALRTHKVENNIDILQLKQSNLFTIGNFICNDGNGDTVFEVIRVHDNIVVLTDQHCSYTLCFYEIKDVDWLKNCYQYKE